MIALTLLLALLAPDDGLTDQIAHCGIAREQIQVHYEADMQDDVAVIATPASTLTAPQLKCLVGLAMSGPLFTFSDPAAQARFDPLVQATQRQAAVAEAREWLADRGLLDKLPVYDPAHQTLAEFGGALETLCGIAPGTVIKAEGKSLNFVPPSDPRLSEADLGRFQCIVAATFAVDPDPKLFTIGFTGNEAPSR